MALYQCFVGGKMKYSEDNPRIKMENLSITAYDSAAGANHSYSATCNIPLEVMPDTIIQATIGKNMGNATYPLEIYASDQNGNKGSLIGYMKWNATTNIDISDYDYILVRIYASYSGTGSGNRTTTVDSIKLW